MIGDLRGQIRKVLSHRRMTVDQLSLILNRYMADVRMALGLLHWRDAKERGEPTAVVADKQGNLYMTTVEEAERAEKA